MGNVASTINTNLQNFGGDLYDAGNQIKNNVSNFATQSVNTGKQVANQIGNNVSDANYNMWNSGLKSFTGKNNSTLTEAFPNAYNDLSKNTGEADEDKVMKFVEEIAKAGIKAIIQPGGSIKDKDSIDKCNELNIAMIFTGKRHFKH